MNHFKVRALVGFAVAAAVAASLAGAQDYGAVQNDKAAQKPGTQQGTQQGGSTAGGTAAAGGGTAQGKAAGPAMVYMLIPVEVAAKADTMKSGCWARIYSNTNYTGDTLTLAGPVSIADMDGPFGMNWDDKVESIELGPKATLTVYDNEAFRDQVAQFKPGQKVADISRPLGFFDEFASVRMSCAKS